MIRLDITNKSFGEKLIFKNTTFHASKGEFIGIKGESGVGKSTLLSMIGLLDNFSGKYELYNDVITRKNKEQIRINNFAYVFQNPYLIPYLTVRENILIPSKNLKFKLSSEEVAEAAKRFNIFDLLDRTPVNLSSGEAERVALCRAVLSKREIILADEPTGNLDPKNASIVMDMFKQINDTYNTTIIMVTHSNLYDDYFNRILYLREHKVVEINEYDI